ncbi:MAG TPA: alpha/beta hydrolase [Pseudolabrys sp.]|nr:alpha/beta hydrolase [Pseudolabrys sp.]
MLIVVAVTIALLCALMLATLIGCRLISGRHPPRGRFVDTASGRLHVLDLDPLDPAGAERTPLVLLHGAGANLEDLRLALGERLRRRFRVILVDRPGSGWSDRTEQYASPTQQAAVLREALARMGIERAILVGHSWGGALAAAYALAFPRHVAGLALLAPVTHPWEDRRVDHYSLATIPAFGLALAYTLVIPVGALILNRMVTSIFSPSPVPAGFISRAAIPLALRPGNFLVNAHNIAALTTCLADTAPRYREIAVPTVVITGDRDRVLPPSWHSHAIAKAVPGAKLIVLKNTGHMPHHAAPERIVAAIEEIADVVDNQQR